MISQCQMESCNELKTNLATKFVLLPCTVDAKFATCQIFILNCQNILLSSTIILLAMTNTKHIHVHSLVTFTSMKFLLCVIPGVA